MRLSIVLLLLAVASNAPLRSEPCSGANAALDTLLEGQTLQGWLEASRSTDVEARARAMAVLQRNPALAIAAAASEDRPMVFDELGLARRGWEAVPALTSLLSCDQEIVRLNAARYLGWIRASAWSTATVLAELLRDPAWEVRAQAALALAQAGVLPDEVLATLATGLEDPRAEVAGACALALRRFGDAAIPVLTRALADSRASVRLHAGKALAGIGRPVPEALPAPVTFLGGDPVPQRIVAVPVLANRDSRAILSSMPTLPPLRAVPAVSCETDRLLILRGDRSAHRAALPVLLDAVESADEGDAFAAEAPADLSAIGDAADVVPILVDALRQQVKGMCPHPTANDELEAIGAPAVPALVSLLRESDVASYWILPSLDRMGADALEAARPVFLEWLVSEFQGRRLDAAIRLARMPLDGPTRIRVASVFEEMLSIAPPALRLESAEGLLRMGRGEVPGVEPALVDLLNHPSDEIRARARAALAEIRFPHPAGP